ncbi:MAG: hypothetical protein ABFD15_04025 [Methanofastidiosum sp.]
MDIRFFLCIIFDIIDFFVRIPGLGTLFDLVGIPVAYYLIGPMGIFYAWELLDITDQLDGFIPTMTILYIISKSGVKLL